MSKPRVVLKYIAIIAAVLLALAGLLVGAGALLIVVVSPLESEFDGQKMAEGLDALFYCPRLDEDGSSVLIRVMARYELVVVATRPTDSTNPLVPSPDKILGDPYTGIIEIEIGAATASRTSIAFDRPPADGDVIEFWLRPVPADPGTVPPTTFPAGDPFADARYVYTFTGGRFAPTGVPEPCLGG